MGRTSREHAFFWVKNREGKKGKRPIGWEGKYLKFYDIEEGQLDNSNFNVFIFPDSQAVSILR